jgi:thiol-disulfide isomerase/thioredoxin
LVLLREKKDDLGLPEIKAYLEQSPEAEYAKYARKILANPNVARQPVAPDFVVTCEDGKRITSDQLAGKVVVIDFWATWCPACRAALPDMKDLVRKYPSDKLMIISSSADHDENAWRDYITKKEMTWPQVFDKNGSLSSSFAVHAFPTYIVIDGDGIIRNRIVGTDPQQSLAYQLKADLKTLLEK